MACLFRFLLSDILSDSFYLIVCVPCTISHMLLGSVFCFLFMQDSATYKGVKLASGQELFSTQLLLAPSFTIASRSVPSAQVENSSDDGLRLGTRKVARGVCITKNSVKPDVANCLVFFPPRCKFIISLIVY